MVRGAWLVTGGLLATTASGMHRFGRGRLAPGVATSQYAVSVAPTGPSRAGVGYSARADGEWRSGPV